MVLNIILNKALIDDEFIAQMKDDGHSVNVFNDFDSAIGSMYSGNNSPADLIIASETAITAVHDEKKRFVLLYEYLSKIRNITACRILLQLNGEPTAEFHELCRAMNVSIQKGDTIDLGLDNPEIFQDNECTDKLKVLSAVPDQEQYNKLVLSIQQINIVGKAATRQQLIDMAQQYSPEVIVMTSDLPGDDDRGITYTVSQISMDIRIIMILTKRLNDLIIGKLERDYGVEFVDRIDRDELELLILRDHISDSPETAEKKRKVKKSKEIDLDTENQNSSEESSGSGIFEAAGNSARNKFSALAGIGSGIGKNVKGMARNISSSDILKKVSAWKTKAASEAHEIEEESTGVTTENTELPEADIREQYVQQEEYNSDPRYRLIAIISNGHTGKSTIAANLAFIASDKRIQTSLVDLNFNQFDMYYHFNINEKQIRQDLRHTGYNKYNMIYNAINEPDIDCLPDIAFQENKYLSVFSGDDEEENQPPDTGKVLKLLDRLRSLYRITIIDTGQYDSLVHNIVSIADTVIFVHDLNPASTRRNEKLLSQLSKITNLKKFYLAVNMADEIEEMSVRDLVKYYKSETGITFRDVFTIPNNGKACVNSSWAREPVYRSKYDSSHELFDSFNNIYSSLFNDISKNKEDKRRNKE
jgi:cellulose biosynthesis protein BcsQ